LSIELLHELEESAHGAVEEGLLEYLPAYRLKNTTISGSEWKHIPDLGELCKHGRMTCLRAWYTALIIPADSGTHHHNATPLCITA